MNDDISEKKEMLDYFFEIIDEYVSPYTYKSLLKELLMKKFHIKV